MLPAKPVIVEAARSTIGSSNPDWRSLTLNDAIDAAIFSEAVARRTQATFKRDLEVRTGHHAFDACTD